MIYCDQVQFALDYPATGACHECAQNCHEKGQLAVVKLIANEEVAWTLVYVHRAFQGDDPGYAQLPYPWGIQQALAILRVYRGPVEIPMYQLTYPPNLYPVGGIRCLTIPFDVYAVAPTDFAPVPFAGYLNQGDPQLISPREVLELYDHAELPVPIGGSTPVLPSNWEYEVRYLYSERAMIAGPGGRYAEVFGATVPDPGEVQLGNTFAHNSRGAPRLIKTTVTHRPEPATEPERKVSASTLYRYQKASHFGNGTQDPVRLKSIFRSSDIDRIRETSWDGSSGWDIYDILLAADEADVGGSGAKLHEFASRTFHHWGATGNDGAAVPLAGYPLIFFHKCDTGSPFVTTLEDQIGLGPISTQSTRTRLALQLNAVRMVRGACDKEGTEGPAFKLYHFLREPDDAYAWDDLYPSIRHHPYRFVKDPQYPWDWTQSSGESPVWVAVVDRYDQWERAEADFANESPDEPNTPDTRRVVYMNAAGRVLLDRTYASDGQVLSSEGYAVTYRYDEHGRLVEEQSTGYNTSENAQNEFPAGLVTVYSYHEEPPGNPTGRVRSDVKSIGIKNGKNGDVYLRSLNARHAEHPEYVLWERTFSENTILTTEPDPAGSETAYSYTFTGDPARLERKICYRSKIPCPDGIDRHPVEIEEYDDQGRLVWQGRGLLADWTTVATSDTLTWDYTRYCEGLTDQGLVDYEVQDVDVADLVPTTTFPSVSYPTGYPRSPAASSSSNPALHRLTDYEHEGWRETVRHPDGRVTVQTMRTRFEENREVSETRQYQLFFDAIGNEYVSVGAVKVETATSDPISMIGMTIAGGYNVGMVQQQVHESWEGTLEPIANLPTGDEVLVRVASLTPEYDSAGRITKLEAKGEDGETLTATIYYDAFHQPMKVVDLDGTITRTLYDPRGRKSRVYKGTLDGDEFWRAGITSGPDDMVLIEKVEYGDPGAGNLQAVRNVGKPSVVRRYRDRPNAQYIDPCADEDLLGIAEEHFYDWRMRDVLVGFKNKGPVGSSAFRRWTATFYDNLDRVVYVAEFDGTRPAGVSDPTAIVPGGALPSVQAILAAGGAGSPNPEDRHILRLSHTIYNAAGQVIEVRDYDVAAADGAMYTSTQTIYDHAERAIITKSPGAADRHTVYDAAGREVSSIAVVGGVEQTRTDTIYELDRPIETITYERFDPSGATLSASGTVNAVRTQTFKWFDAAGRVIATADVGTGVPGAAGFVNGTLVSRPAAAPVVMDASEELVGVNPAALGAQSDLVKITGYQYDDKGRAVRTARPDGTLELRQYDDLGQLVRLQEVPASGQPRTTFYKYELGRLTKIGVALVDGVSDLNWEDLEGELQITRFVYGADVKDESTATITSRNNSLLAAVHFPSRTSGQPNAAADLRFTYYPDGLLARRLDASGVELSYRYNEQGDHVETLVDTTAGDDEYPGLWAFPPDRVTKVTSEYSELGELLRSTAYDGARIIADNQFAYDSRGNLLKDVQSHGAASSSASPRTQYAWSYSPAGGAPTPGHNFDRLLSMTYPMRAGTSIARVVSFDYGNNAGDADSV